MEWDDQDGLEGHELRDDETFPSAADRRAARRSRLWIVALVALVTVGVVAYLLVDDGEKESGVDPGQREPVTAEPLAGPERDDVDEPPARDTEVEAESFDAATLRSSAARDRVLRDRLEELAGESVPGPLVAGEDLTRRVVAALDAVARGGAVAPLFPDLRPERPFAVVEREGRIYPAPENARRYDRWVGFLTSIDAGAAARAFRRLEPLLQAAYRELGYPEGDLERTVESAVDRLLATPLPESPPRLVPKGARGYAYADPRLERLTPAQKQLLRMGPENQRRVMTWLERFETAL